MTAPRLGFVGLGWIGAMRLEAIEAAGCARISALCDAAADRLDAVGAARPGVPRFAEYDALLAYAAESGLDGVVIATPNALHASQTIAALEQGLAVFCQKPLALSAAEAREMVAAARRADRLLGVDYSYRHTDAARTLHEMVRSGALGRVFHIESTFHNAYGPDKAWCHDPERSGGGALIDLGVHQVDLPLWLLGHPRVRHVQGRLFRKGAPLEGPGIDDFAVAHLELEGGAAVHMAVSWNAHAGRDCIIRTALFGTAAGAELRNVHGSFYDFETVRHDGRAETVLGRESRAWLGRGICGWVERLAEAPHFDPAIEASIAVAEVIDAVYGRA